MKKKYELTNETINVAGRTLYRIKAIRDFDNVKAGELGGYVEKEENLSHEGNCWIYDIASVSCNGKVSGDARVSDDAWVTDDAEVFDEAEVSGNAEVLCNARVYGNAHIYGHSRLYDNAEVFDEAEVFDFARVSCDAKVNGNSKCMDKAWVRGHIYNSLVCGVAKVRGNAKLYNETLCE